MIEITEVPGSNIIEMSVAGKISAEEFDAALRTFEAAIGKHGSIRVLEIIGKLDVPPIPWSKFWDDVKFSLDHLSQITHVAVVADQRWITAWVRMLNPLFKPEMKVFATQELEQARSWLRVPEAG